jgi:hypothetical protein
MQDELKIMWKEAVASIVKVQKYAAQETNMKQVARTVRSKTLWRWYISTIITFLDIIRPPVFI